jgi:hypothetical protein
MNWSLPLPCEPAPTTVGVGRCYDFVLDENPAARNVRRVLRVCDPATCPCDCHASFLKAHAPFAVVHKNAMDTKAP